jgi:hypothetical protein
MLNIIQKKGNPKELSGKLIAYATVEPGDELQNQNSPLQGMIQNGILAVSGNYEEQHNLQDFLRKEFNTDIEKGIGGFLEHLKNMNEEDMPGGVNPDELKRKFDNFSSMEIIPVPAKVTFYASLEELLSKEADIFDLGHFNVHSHAHLSVTSFPILYQARFREQQSLLLQDEISQLLTVTENAPEHGTLEQLSRSGLVLNLPASLSAFDGKLDELLMNQVLPGLIYNMDHQTEFELSIQRLRTFMKGFAYPEEFQNFINEMEDYRTKGGNHTRKLELLCQKVGALHHENFEKAAAIQQQISGL